MSSRLESFRARSGVPGVGAFFEERFPTVEAVGKLRFCWAKRKTPLDVFSFFLCVGKHRILVPNKDIL